MNTRYTLFLLSTISLVRGSPQTGQQSTTDRINDADRRSPSSDVVAGTCGSFGIAAEKGRAAAASLARSGQSAIPEIDAVLDAIEKKGPLSPSSDNANWLLYAYATIEGPAAFQRLQQLRGDPSFRFLDSAIDIASALALGQTSYVTSWRRKPSHDPCIAPTPRDPLDQLVLAWENDDRVLLRKSLGPEAAAALNAVLGGRGWEVMRSQFWHVKTSEKTAVGYRFDSPAPWAEPAMTLSPSNPTITLSLQHGAKHELDTFFKDASGKDCGRFRLRLLDPQPTSGPSYLIDNPDLDALLELISRCAGN
jgi:hypothetical protein